MSQKSAVPTFDVTPLKNHTLPKLDAEQLSLLRAVEKRVLWLATAMVDHANRVRPNSSGVKVGGHQTSSASITTIMTALWFKYLRAEDQVSVKPHASPVFYAIKYLLGEVDRSALTTLREFGGLQSYPSRVKELARSDFSTGSVGIGATAPIWAALANRVRAGRGGRQRTTARFYSLVGDAELDEGAVWEAILDPQVRQLGEVVWIVDLNRQSLDRVVPSANAERLEGLFAAAGWQTLTAKYGTELGELFGMAGGEELRRTIDEMHNAEYQRLLRCPAEELPGRLSVARPQLAGLLESVEPKLLFEALRGLGGHDFQQLDQAFEAIDDTRPTVIFAYTVKGYGLPSQGHPQNHSSLLKPAQLVQLGDQLGIDAADPWAAFVPGSAESSLCQQVADRLRRTPVKTPAAHSVPEDLGRTPQGKATTQAALGRTLLDLLRQAPEVAARIVTVAPDVSSSTNLGGWVNKVGVFSATQATQDWFDDDPETILHWRESPAGQHVELGIAEMNLVGLLGELGVTWSRWGEPLLPIGVVYDPFITRALEPWSFGIYAGGQSILIGTPSGVTLGPEGGAHQSIITPSIGLEQPDCLSYEPAFALDAEWCLLSSLAQLGRPNGSSAYLRLSTRPIDQQLAEIPVDPAARERRRRHTVAGGYLLRQAQAPAATIVAMGAMLPEALAANERLLAMGVETDVVVVTSPGLLYEALQGKQGLSEVSSSMLERIFPAARARPMVTLLDGHPHTLSFLAGINQVPAVNLGVSSFGQSGAIEDLYRYYGIDAEAVIRAVLDLIEV